MRSVEYTLGADHGFRYAFTGGSGRAGQIAFGSDADVGTWRVEHDVLVLSGEKLTRKYLLVGATVGAEGQRLLVLQPEPFSLGPSAEFELYVSR